MRRKQSKLEQELLNDFENLLSEQNDSVQDDDNITERTANIWRQLLELSGENEYQGTTALMTDTFRRNVWAAMTGHLDMSDYRMVWEYDPETSDVSIYNYLENEPSED